jgi:hypothetical protein
MIELFSKHLFWDTDRQKLNMDDKESYIILQVLEYGKINDWRLILKYYGLPKITAVSKKARSLDPKTLSFISTITGISKDEFRCFTYQQSSPKHWNF